MDGNGRFWVMRNAYGYDFQAKRMDSSIRSEQQA